MSNRTFQIISPIDNSVYAEREIASEKNIHDTISIGKKAQLIWKKTSIQDRAEICRKAVDYFVSHSDIIGEELTWQMGRPIRYTPFEITKGFKERAEYMIQIAEETLSEKIIERSDNFYRFLRREPLGLILVLAPWNYPYLTSVNTIIPAIMAGNTVILKHAQQTPLCAERYAEAFAYAGLPEGVFQYLQLSHAQVSLIIEDPRVDYVAFTGSVPGGKAVQKAIGERFIGSGLELGGKDPAYVRSDANLEYAIENLVDGSFFNSGQSCCGIERIYVQESLFNSFVEGFVELTKKYVLDNPLLPETTLGPMVRTNAADYANDQIGRAIQAGARTLIDPRIFKRHQIGTPYMAPQVLMDVNHSMEVMREETFAPVVGIMPVKSDSEAITLMNDSRYGLTASVWTQDMDTALQIADLIETGTCFMNRCDYLDPALAWTGVKDSGRGVTLSSIGYEILTRPKSFHLKSI
ncbi:MAG: aldehyde dehydrogenase family protein [Saprospiraceae bacterium]|nr:aldehyde dehydrogenase family protein [Saprospiraceae bacterium]